MDSAAPNQSIPNPAMPPQPEMAAAPESPASGDGSSGKKKLLILFGVVVVVLILAVGGLLLFKDQFSTQSSSEPVTLTYWGMWESPEIMKPLIEQFEEDNPNVTINYEQRPIEQHYATVKSRISQAGISDAMPDIVRVHNTWVPVLSNYLSPVPQSAYSREEYEATFYNATKDSLLVNGQYYGIPLMMDGLALVYNQQLFTQAGITAPPATWDDVRRDAAKIAQRNDDGDLTVGGIALGSARNVDHFPDIIGLLMAQNGVVFQDSSGNVNFHKSITADGRNLGAEAISFYKIFTTSEKVWDESMEMSTLAFSRGKVGMILVPSWRVLSLVNQNPELQIKVAAVPHLTTDQSVGYASYWTEVVPQASPNKAVAWKFLQFLSEREQQLALYNSAQSSRPFGEPYSRKDLSSAMSTDPIVSPFGQQASGYKSWLFADNTGAVELNGEINAALSKAVAESANSEQTPKKLEDLANQVTNILTRERQ